MKTQNKLVVAGTLLNQEINNLGRFGRRVINQPSKTVVIAGGAKVSDKINVLKQFVQVGVKAIFIGGKMANTFLIAQKTKTKTPRTRLKQRKHNSGHKWIAHAGLREAAYSGPGVQFGSFSSSGPRPATTHGYSILENTLFFKFVIEK